MRGGVSGDDRKVIEEWVGRSGLGQLLGLRLEALDTERAVLSLPYRLELSNGDGALHGGVTASLVSTSASALARAVLGPSSGPWHPSMLQVLYLSAALGEGLEGEARLLRRGKELAHVEVEVATKGGKPVARGLVTVRGRFAAAPIEPPPGTFPASETDPGPMGPYVASIPFHASLGVVAEHMAGGRSRILMAAGPATSDGTGTHEGALLALIDTTGAMAAWAETGPGPYKASTPSLQARILGPCPVGDLVGLGRVLQRDRELLFCAVEVRRQADGAVVADGAVNYRIVTPDLERRDETRLTS